MLRPYNLFMRKIGFLTCLTLLYAKEPKTMDEFVYDHFMLTKSKMECSPTLWLDVQEGYLRHYTVHYADQLLDSLNQGLSSYHAGIRHFPRIEDLRVEVMKGEDFDYIIDPPIIPTSNVNYFSSVKD